MSGRTHQLVAKKRIEKPSGKPSLRQKKPRGWAKELREMKAKYSEIFNFSPLGICEIDLRTRKYLQANDVVLRTLGMTRKEFLSHPLLDSFSEESKTILMERMKELIARKGDYDAGEYQLIAKDGRRIWLLMHIRVIYEGGGPTRILTIFHDITARKEAEKVLAKAQGELEARVRARTAKLTKLNHNLWVEVHERRQAEKALRKSEAEAKRLAQENALIAEIGRVISSNWKIEEVYEKFAQEAQKLIPFDRIVINLNDYGSSSIHMAYVSGRPLAQRQMGDVIPLPDSVNKKIARDRRGVILQPESVEELAREFPSLVRTYQEGFLSMMSVPLISGDEVIGALHFRATRAKAYTLQDLSLAQRIANQVAGAIANAQLFLAHQQMEEAVRKSEMANRRLAREAEIIAEIGRIISSTLRIEEVYGHFAQEVGKLIPFDRISVSLNEYEKNTILMAYVSGIDLEDRRVGDRYPFQGSLNQKNADARCGLIIVPDSESRLKVEYPSLVLPYQKGIRSMMAVPLISRDRVIGTLNFRAMAPKAYAEQDLNLAQRIANQIAGAIANAHLFLERERAEEALRQSEERFRRLAEDAPLGISLMNPDWTFDYLNPTFTKTFGYTLEDLPDKMVWFEKAYPDPAYREANVSAWRRDLVDRPQRGKTFANTCHVRCKEGTDKLVDIRSAIMGNGQHLLTYLDVTDRMRAEEEKARLEEQLRQAQKMEAIGTLAGGIAHDFNNILAAIIGYAEIIGFDLPSGSQTHRNLRELLLAGHRARDLVKQILAFGRKSEQERKPLRIASVVKETLKLMRASLPSTIEIRLLLEEEETLVQADPTQIHQLIMNLCTNGAQAMEEKGGILEVQLVPLRVDAEMAKMNPELQEGAYVCLIVRDRGHGIPPDIMPRIFEPYFTTKDVGKGTGLGLAVVHGIVKSHGGAISVSSEVGNGTTFEIYLPKLDRMERIEDFALCESVPMGQGERILLVDDEPALVDAGQKMLEHLGYTVEVRTSSIEALKLFRQEAYRFDLVLTDLTMPHLTGDRLAQEMIRIRPGIPIILCTGFSEKISPEVARQMGIKEYLLKPLLMGELARGIRQILNLEEIPPSSAFSPKGLASAS